MVQNASKSQKMNFVDFPKFRKIDYMKFSKITNSRKYSEKFPPPIVGDFPIRPQEPLIDQISIPSA